MIHRRRWFARHGAIALSARCQLVKMHNFHLAEVSMDGYRVFELHSLYASRVLFRFAVLFHMEGKFCEVQKSLDIVVFTIGIQLLSNVAPDSMTVG
jgi:hypothetical protein